MRFHKYSMFISFDILKRLGYLRNKNLYGSQSFSNELQLSCSCAFFIELDIKLLQKEKQMFKKSFICNL